MRILGIDPGYAIVGYGLIDYDAGRYRTIDYGAILTEAHTPFEDRLAIIHAQLSEIIGKYSPDAMSVEQLFFTNNQKTAIAVAQARGVIVLAGRQQNVGVFEYTPLQVKQSVVGYGRAVKQQVMEMTKVLLKLPSIPKPDDTADALALAICHAHSSGSLMARAYAGR